MYRPANPAPTISTSSADPGAGFESFIFGLPFRSESLPVSRLAGIATFCIYHTLANDHYRINLQGFRLLERAIDAKLNTTIGEAKWTRTQPGIRRRPGMARERIAARAEPHFWLFFNGFGEIGYCNNSLAKLIGREGRGSEGAGRHLDPQQLPLSQETPGGNIGMMANHMGRRCPLDLVLDDGRSLPMFGLVRSVRLGTGPAFIVQLKPRGRSGRRRPDL